MQNHEHANVRKWCAVSFDAGKPVVLWGGTIAGLRSVSLSKYLLNCLLVGVLPHARNPLGRSWEKFENALDGAYKSLSECSSMKPT